MPSFSCSAIIFDLDGVLIDSNALYEEHWALWAAQRGVPLEGILAIHHGRPVHETIAQAAPHLDAQSEAKAYKDSLQSFGGVQIFPGVRSLLQRLPVHRWGIATSAPKPFALRLTAHLALPMPEVFVAGDDITRGKPHPMPYLLAAQRLGVRANQCVVVEDAPAGVAAATAAGAFVIGLLTTNTAEQLQGAHAFAGSIADLTVRVSPDGLAIRWGRCAAGALSAQRPTRPPAQHQMPPQSSQLRPSRAQKT